MANVARKWLPLVIIGVVTAAGGFALRDVASPVVLDLRGLLPVPLEPEADTAPRWVAIFAVPLLATVVWASMRLGSGVAGLRVTRALFRSMPDTLGDPATIERFRPSYDAIVLWVVVLVLGFHAGIVAAALGHARLTPKIVSVVMGLSLVAAGNVMPRVRRNMIAGVRTRATFTDPALWRNTHRVLGMTIVMAGAITVVVGLAAPTFGLSVGIVSLVLACIAASIAGARVQRTATTRA